MTSGKKAAKSSRSSRTIKRKRGSTTTAREMSVDDQIANHPEFQKRIARAREDLRAGRGIKLEALDDDLAVIRERAGEPTVSFDEVLRDMRRRGKL
jgi:hypothetical protein